MSMLSSIYKVLRGEKSIWVDRAMAEALPTADRVAQRYIVLSLLQRRREGAMAAIVRSLHLLETDLQEIVLEHADRLDGAVRVVLTDDDPQNRANGMELVSDANAYRLSYLLSTHLREADAAESRQAATSLLGLVEGVMTGAGMDEGDDDAKRVLAINQVSHAVADACGSFHKHGRRDALLAGARLLEVAPERVRELMGNRKSGTHTGMGQLLRRMDQPVAVRSMLRFAGIRDMQGAVMEALDKPAVQGRLNDILDGGHLLAAPDIRRVVRRVVCARQLLPGPGEVKEFSSHARRRLGRWMDTINAPPSERLRVLMEMTEDPDRMTRLIGVRSLMKMEGEDACNVLAGVCFDEDESVARLAFRKLESVEWSGLSALVMKLVGSKHPSVSALAERRLSPLGFRRLCKHWDTMETPTRKAAGRALLRLDKRFHLLVGREMESNNDEDRFRAVMMVRELEQVSYFEDGLLRLLADKTARVAAAAAGALGQLRGGNQQKLCRALGGVIRHSNDRVRANAVESLAGLGLVSVNREVIEKVLKSGGARSRANAVQALLGKERGDAASVQRATLTLNDMLLDTDARHRSSALWVVENLKLNWAAQQVATLARYDRNISVRRKATVVMRILAGVEKTSSNVVDETSGRTMIEMERA